MPIPILIDTDDRIDAGLAILLALSDERLEVRAVVATGSPTQSSDGPLTPSPASTATAKATGTAAPAAQVASAPSRPETARAAGTAAATDAPATDAMARAPVATSIDSTIPPVVHNIRRMIAALGLPHAPPIGCGMSVQPCMEFQTHAAAADRVTAGGAGRSARSLRGRPAMSGGIPPPSGSGRGGAAPASALQEVWTNVDLPIGDGPAVESYVDVYRRAIDAADGNLQVVILGPCTTMAAMLDGVVLASELARIHVVGGALRHARGLPETIESNFGRDPAAARRVLSCGAPVCLSPLDLAHELHMDESHAARMAAANARQARVAGRLAAAGLARLREQGVGHLELHAAASIGAMLWPEFFGRIHARLEVGVDASDAGRCHPVLGGAADAQAEVLSAVRGADFVENMLESLCRERFVV